MGMRYDYDRGRFGRRYADEDDRPLRYDDYDDDRRQDRDERGFFDRARDEVRSWVGDEDADRRRRLDDAGYWRTSSRFGSVRAKDVMTRDVVTVQPNDPVERAARLMSRHDCGSLPVVDSRDRLIGMVTDRDIVTRVVAEGMDHRYAAVRDCMTDEAFACHADDPVEATMRKLSHHQIRRLPIVDDHDRVVGIVSVADVARLAKSRAGRGERRAVADVVGAISEPGNEPYRH